MLSKLLAISSLTMATLSLGYLCYKTHNAAQTPNNFLKDEEKKINNSSIQHCSYCEVDDHNLKTCDKEPLLYISPKTPPKTLLLNPNAKTFIPTIKKEDSTTEIPNQMTTLIVVEDEKAVDALQRKLENANISSSSGTKRTAQRHNFTFRKTVEYQPVEGKTTNERLWPSFLTPTASKYKPTDKNHPQDVSVCSYCETKGHDIKGCPIFLVLKRQVSKKEYVNEDGELLAQDDLGCCAAGIFPYLYRANEEGKTVKHVLLALENRGGKMLYNFLGGRRDTPKETPQSIAKREFWEELMDVTNKTDKSPGSQLLTDETIERLDREKLGQVYWSGFSKFGLFAFQLTDAELNLVEKSKTAIFDEISGLKWFTINELLDQMNESKKDSLLHSFTSQWLRELDRYHGLDRFV
jgi:8-oxo-dGTP pyrophosphatase MutT (NUDIX family)